VVLFQRREGLLQAIFLDQPATLHKFQKIVSANLGHESADDVGTGKPGGSAERQKSKSPYDFASNAKSYVRKTLSH
jgi:hypothetical protein